MNITTATAKTSRDLAQKAVKQIAQEPFEILKTAREQVIAPHPQENPPSSADMKPQVSEKKIKAKDTRMLSALNREIEDIRRDKLFSQLQAKVSNGEEISLENYRELTLEQKQVLKAQIEAYKLRVSQEQSEKPVGIPSSKPSRKLFSFGKKQAEKLQTKVERPMPPSG